MQTATVQHWANQPTKALIEHILTAYHDKHREQLPELIQLARKIEAVHSDHVDCPVGLTEHLSEMFQELESHMMKEEQILFPMLAGGLFPQAPIAVMLEEHDHHELMLERLQFITQRLKAPYDACGSWIILYDGLRQFINELQQHIDLENSVLFQPKAAPKHGNGGHCCGGCQ